MKRFLTIFLSLIMMLGLTVAFNAGCKEPYILQPDGTYFFNDVDVSATKVIIPASYKGKAVTGIASGAFKNNENIKQVIIPLSVKTISESAFENTPKLTSINLDKIEKIGKNAFKNSLQLTIEYELELDSIKQLGEGCFDDCYGIVSVSIGDKIDYIPKNAFRDCVRLVVVDLSSSIKTIGDSAFEECRVLTQFNFADIQNIGKSAFKRCAVLQTLNLPKVEVIKQGAFEGCSSVAWVEVGAYAKQIYLSAFANLTLNYFNLGNSSATWYYYKETNSSLKGELLAEWVNRQKLNDGEECAQFMTQGSYPSCFICTSEWANEQQINAGDIFNKGYFD